MSLPTLTYLHGEPAFNFQFSLFVSLFLGGETSATSTAIVYENPTFTSRMVFTGTFVVDGMGVVQSGVMTGFEVFAGATKFTVGSDFNVSAVDLLAAIQDLQSMNDEALLNILFNNTQQVGSADSDDLFTIAGIVLGRAGDDFLHGGDAGLSILKGGKGDDALFDSQAANKMWGGQGHDSFNFGDTIAPDFIKDFDRHDDTIGLNFFEFVGIPLGFLNNGVFGKGTVAATPTQVLVYDQKTGQLFYDPDGSNPMAQVLIVTLDPHTKLHASDIVGNADIFF